MSKPVDPLPSEPPKSSTSSQDPNPVAPAPFASGGAGSGNAMTSFLSSLTGPVTEQDVKAFTAGLMRTFSVLLKQAEESAKRAAEAEKDAIEGR